MNIIVKFLVNRYWRKYRCLSIRFLCRLPAWRKFTRINSPFIGRSVRQKIPSAFKLRLLADKVTCNFSIQSVLSNFHIKGILSHSFPLWLCFPIFSCKERAARILSREERAGAFGNSRGQGLKISFSSPKKLEISSLTGGLLRFLFALESIQNGCAMREYATRFILVIP